MPAVKLSVAIITFNEERNIARCLKSVASVADEIVVVDSNSTDRTRQLAEAHGARVVVQPFLGYTEQKNFAAEQCTHPHVLSLDADEALSEQLQQSVVKVKEAFQAAAYNMNRLNSYCGTWVKHSGWYPDRKLRLYDRRQGSWQGEQVHEFVQMQAGATVAHLHGDLLHYTYYTVDEHISRTARYSTLAAQAFYQQGKQHGVLKLIFSPIVAFFKHYIWGRGFMHGFYGLTIALVGAWGKAQRTLQLMEYNRKGRID